MESREKRGGILMYSRNLFTKTVFLPALVIFVLFSFDSSAFNKTNAIQNNAHKNSIIKRNKNTVREQSPELAPSKAGPVHLPKEAELNSPRREMARPNNRQFVEVEVVIENQFTLDYLKSLPLAPESTPKLLKKPLRVVLQLPARRVTKLISEGADVRILRKFILVEDAKPADDKETKSDDSRAAYCYGENSSNVSIPDCPAEWAYSVILISCAPDDAEVTSMDVHFEILHDYVGDLVVDVTNQNMNCEQRLFEDEFNGATYLSRTITGIAACYGEKVNQLWALWALDQFECYDDGYIDYWWIKVYYEGGEPLPNDECLDAIPVTEDVPYIGSTVGATGTDITTCGDSDSADVWHSFTPLSTSSYTISLCGSSFDTTLAVFYDCGAAELACNDDECDLQSEIDIELTAGHEYFIRVAGYNGDTGNYILLVTGGGAVLENDNCIDATEVTLDTPYSGNTSLATGTYTSYCGSNDTIDVWHYFTPVDTGTYTVSLMGSSFDTTLVIFDECGGMELVCNDDCDNQYQSKITMRLTGGQTYLIRVAGYNGEFGAYQLIVTSEGCPLPVEPYSPSPLPGETDVGLEAMLLWNDAGDQILSASSTKDSLSESPIISKLIYGNDDRNDEYQISNPDILEIGDSTVAILHSLDLTDNGNGTFSLPTETFAQYYLNSYGIQLCSDEPFRNQPNPAHCSGFLVAPDIIATAGHCVDFCCDDMVFVFGFVMLNSTTPVLTIDESEIYYSTEVIDSLYSDTTDWALVRLDRPVTGHKPVTFRTSGLVSTNQPLMVIGHPMGLPRKYAGGATVRDNNPALPYFRANTDTYIGNSGSAVFNASTLEVEGILVRGNEDFEYDVVYNCDRSNVCPDSGCPGWEEITRTTEFANALPWVKYDVYFDVVCPPEALICSDIDTPTCEPYDPCTPDGLLRSGITYYWQVVTKNICGDIPGPAVPGECWSFTTEIMENITVEVGLSGLWMYQSLPGQTNSTITANITQIDDPQGNGSYTYQWEIELPGDVSVEPATVSGGGTNDTSWTFAAPGCDIAGGISDSGQTFKVKVTVVGDDYGNYGTVQKEFGIALLGDANNDTVVNGADRSIINVFWRTGVAEPYTLEDCDINCDTVVNVADRSIDNAIWRGLIGSNSITAECPFRSTR